MTPDLLLALIVFAAVTSYTPGPNNTLLMAAGMNFGYRRSLPMVLGVCLGFPLMLGCVGLGLGEIFKLYPALYTGLKYAGAAYMLWLAWKIATSAPRGDGPNPDARPMSFLQIALFQWINPKAWIMAITALAAYTAPDAYYVGVLAVVASFALIGFTSSSAWTLFGAALRHLLNDPRYYRWINYGLALLLVISLRPLLTH